MQSEGPSVTDCFYSADMDHLHRFRVPALLVLAALVLGVVIRGLLPPFIVDEPFWREFLTGPPAAGLFALLGAVVAYSAARIAARTARRAAERQEWWDRAQWALDLARSDVEVERTIGLQALDALSRDATRTEYEMVVAVTSAVSTGEGVGHVRRGRGQWPWRRRQR